MQNFDLFKTELGYDTLYFCLNRNITIEEFLAIQDKAFLHSIQNRYKLFHRLNSIFIDNLALTLN